MLHIPEKIKIVAGSGAVTTNGGVTGDFISMANVLRAYVVVVLTQAVAHQTGIDIVQSTVVAGSDAKAFTKTLPIWANEDVSTSSTLTAQTAAVTYNVANTAKTKQIVFMIDSEKLDVANGFDCIGVTIDNSSQATNFCAITYILEMRYPEAEVIS
jgi:hypothetical protein